MLTGEEDETRTMHVPADHAHKVLPAKDIQPNQAGGPMAQHRVKPAHLPTGGHNGTDGVVGNWNGNRGGASRTERGKTSGSPATSVREFLTEAGRLENHT
jgi:hypothetical protein